MSRCTSIGPESLPAAPFRRISGQRRGTSLVEVLVVLVILIIGMFAIAQLFPGGFFSIGHTGAVTQAAALAQRNEDFLLNNREHLPDAIIGLEQIPTAATGVFRAEVTPDDLLAERPYRDNTINGYTGPPIPDPRFSGPNQVRRIQGEHFKVPPPTLGFGPQGETVALYRSLFSPIYSDGPVLGTALGVSASAATPLERLVWDSSPTRDDVERLYRLGSFGYGINYRTNQIFVLSITQDRQYRFEASFRTSAAGQSQTIPDNCLFVPAGQASVVDAQGSPVTIYLSEISLATGNTVAQHQFDVATERVIASMAVSVTPPPDCILAGLPAGAVLDPGSDLVHRRFRRLAVNTQFSSDPYEFKVYDTVLGLFGFHPAAASLPIPQQQGRGLTARIDYDVDDWFILRQDEVAPSEFVDPAAVAPNRMHAIRLSTGPIKRIGDIEDTVNFPAVLGGGPGAVDTTFEYQGLVRFYPASPTAPARNGTPGMDVILVDLQTGLVIDNTTLTRPADALLGGSNLNGEIDYAKGVIHLREMLTFRTPDFLGAQPVAPPVPAAGRHLRIYYRAANDFAVATFKPASNYYLQPNPALFVQPDPRRQQMREAYAGLGSGYVLFNGTDAEKLVAVDYTWINRNTLQKHVETGELQRVQAPGLPTAPTAGYAGPGGLDPGPRWWIRLSHSDPDPSKGAADSGADADVLPGSVVIRGIRGVSFHNRVVWREAGKWKSRERTTILSREYSR